MKSLLTLFACLLLSAPLLSQNDFSKYMNDGNYSMQQKDYVNAIKQYSKALEYKSANINAYKIADAYIYRATCRFMLMNNESAQADLDAALKLKPEYARIYELKSSFYLNSKMLDKCIEWCEKGLAVKANDDELSLLKARALTGLKKYNESNKVYFGLVEENPKNLTAYKMIGNNFQMIKSWDSAQKYFDIAIQLNPLDYASYYDRGISHAERQDFAAALTDIELAMKIDSTTRYVGYNNIAYFIKLKEKNYTGAIEYYDKALKMKPDFSYSYSNRGFAKLKLGDIKGAYKDIRKSLELDGTNSYAYKNLALVCIEDGKKKEACTYLKKALELGYKESYDDEVDELMKTNCQ